MEALLFEEINAKMDNSPIQHYVSSLYGSVNAGEAALLDKEYLLPANFWSNVATIIQKQESPSGCIIKFYVFPRLNGIEVPCLFNSLEENLHWLSSPGGYSDSIHVYASRSQTKSLLYLIQEGDILSGQKAFALECWIASLYGFEQP
jgi:hypothetical protein